MHELSPLVIPLCSGMIAAGLIALPGIYKQLKKNYQLRNSLKDVQKKYNLARKEPTPQFIRVSDQADGINFDIKGEIPWVAEGQIVKEYIATTTVRTDVRKQLKKCEYAWRKEAGLFFQYPDFGTGLERNVRISDARDVSVTDEAGKLRPLLELTVVLTQADYDDMKKNEGPTGV